MTQGDQRTLLDTGSPLPVGTLNSPDYWLINGGGLLITITVENANGGTLTDVNLQSRHGSSYDTIWANAAQAITLAGTYQYLIAPGAPGAASYKAKLESYPPVTGRIQIINTVAQMTIQVKVESVGP
jgi:hypothetical protein